MSADEILSINKCGDLFPYGEDAAKAKYRELVKLWHPDTNKSAEAFEVFGRINALYDRARELLKNGQWEKTDFILLTKENGKHIAVNYDTFFLFELGRCYVSKTKVIYVFDSDKEKYYKNAVQRISAIRYGDKKMEEDLGRFLPKPYQNFRTKSGEFVLVLDKPEDVYPLKSVCGYFGGSLDDRHAAWIISRLCNLACYLKYSGLVHNGISIDNCFISPNAHSVLLLGGWWYAVREGENMLGAAKEIFEIMPVSAKSTKRASAVTDLESVKLIGRKLVGSSAKAPKPFMNFLTGGSGSSSYEEYEKWDKALYASYGERRFVKMEINDLYRKED